MSQAFSQTNILSGFKSTGIHIFNSDLFKEDDFMCSSTTDRNFPDDSLLSEDSTTFENRQEQIVSSGGLEVTSYSQCDVETASFGDS
ncbi:unnamed protein product [Euphydryas editha]|uniref:Uncharacterized protein n=1 Tax=Euphydryas editha TaxID=104508 RepID=A0AAU9U140_EUPED|nr:unnamed protein product [Euphydryas editha]